MWAMERTSAMSAGPPSARGIPPLSMNVSDVFWDQSLESAHIPIADPKTRAAQHQSAHTSTGPLVVLQPQTDFCLYRLVVGFSSVWLINHTIKRPISSSNHLNDRSLTHVTYICLPEYIT